MTSDYNYYFCLNPTGEDCPKFPDIWTMYRNVKPDDFPLKQGQRAVLTCVGGREITVVCIDGEKFQNIPDCQIGKL